VCVCFFQSKYIYSENVLFYYYFSFRSVVLFLRFIVARGCWICCRRRRRSTRNDRFLFFQTRFLIIAYDGEEKSKSNRIDRKMHRGHSRSSTNIIARFRWATRNAAHLTSREIFRKIPSLSNNNINASFFFCSFASSSVTFENLLNVLVCR